MLFFEWDPRKAATNWHKHQIDFADVATVFDDPMAITVSQDHADEDRFATLGRDAAAQILVVIYTRRSADTIRIISARRAQRGERKQYEEIRNG